MEKKSSWWESTAYEGEMIPKTGFFPRTVEAFWGNLVLWVTPNAWFQRNSSKIVLLCEKNPIWFYLAPLFLRDTDARAERKWHHKTHLDFQGRRQQRVLWREKEEDGGQRFKFERKVSQMSHKCHRTIKPRVRKFNLNPQTTRNLWHLPSPDTGARVQTERIVWGGNSRGSECI